jgi:hypothetical protein
MVLVVRRSRTVPPLAPARLLVLLALLFPGSAAAQRPGPQGVPAADSAEAVATACAVVLALRPPAARQYRCALEGYQESETEYVIRVRERAPRGAAALPSPRSEVRLSKREPSVLVTREPEL